MTTREMQILGLYDMKQKLLEKRFPPSFNDDFEFYKNETENRKDEIAFNCYAYSMQFDLLFSQNDIIKYKLYRPGFLSSSFIPSFGNETLVRAVMDDCDFLGLSYEEVSIDSRPNDNSYKIIIFKQPRINTPDFHFARQNEDLSWSHKKGWGSIPTIVSNPLESSDYSYLTTINISKKQSK